MDHFPFTNTQKIKSTWNVQDGSVHKAFLEQVPSMQKRIYLALYLTEVTKLSDGGDQVTQTVIQTSISMKQKNAWPLQSLWIGTQKAETNASTIISIIHRKKNAGFT